MYDHLRDYASRGHSIVFLSSELEEFIGLCGRVVVFRHGSIFDSFIEDEIHPDRILEAMFGQTERQGAHRHRHTAGDGPHSTAEVYDFGAGKSEPRPKAPVGRIKILETDPEAGTVSRHAPIGSSEGGIKVVYFDD